MMNELFVNIKVDREERPDLDAIYHARLAAHGRAGRLAADHVPDARWRAVLGRNLFPARAAVRPARLPAGSEAMPRPTATRPRQVARTSRPCATALQRSSAAASAAARSAELLDPIAERAAARSRPVMAASAARRNSPSPVCSSCCGARWLRTRPARLARRRRHARRMCQGGIYDHLGGGFARYSTDARWLVPHFEKMLYDNAQLIDLLTLVWQETRNPLYRQRVAETLDWVVREMRRRKGGFAAASTPIASVTRANSMSGPRPRSIAVLGDDAPVFKQRLRRHRRKAIGKATDILNRSDAPALAETTPRSGSLACALSCCGCVKARTAGLGRQGARRLERPDDRGDGKCRAGVRAARLGQGRPRRLQFCLGTWRLPMVACCTAGAPAEHGIRRALTTMPIYAAPQ